ncbi:unnamed protein product [Auanema sp. JU1783]|nr:unnamed protein product [Auanema sp. JU1783]
MRLAIKSSYGAEFRRFNITVGTGIPHPTCDEFVEMIHSIHKLTDEQKDSTTVSYISKDGTTLPISNDDNLRKALDERPSTLRILLRNKGESLEERFGYGITDSVMQKRKKSVSISSPQDFRRVSSILDADSLPLELRRVQLCKTYPNKPLGFFIRNGYTTRMCAWGPVQVATIYISRLLPHGLAASTNLLNVNDEILEVNGIDISGKTLDQVTDIMTANAANLILTIRPAYPSQYQYYPFIPYPPPAYNIPAPPGYCSTLPFPPSPHMDQYYMRYGFNPADINKHDTMGNTLRSPYGFNTFSRESTWRLSDKKCSLSSSPTSDPSNTVDSRRRPRPYSMHCNPHHVYMPSFAYGC